MESDITQRIRQIIEDNSLSESSFAKIIGSNQRTINQQLKGERSLSLDTVNKIISSFEHISPEWLLTGKGGMLKENEDKTAPASVPESSVNYRFVPLLNLDAVGGMHRTNSEGGDEYPEELIPFADAREGDVCLHVSGDSMAPTCPSGSLVLVREVTRWKEYFGYGNLFVLLLDDGRRILKEVQKYLPDSKDYVLCRSHNEKYPEEELPKSLIKGVFKVIKIQSDRGW